MNNNSVILYDNNYHLHNRFEMTMPLNYLITNQRWMSAATLSLVTLLFGCNINTLFAEPTQKWQPILSNTQPIILQSAITHKDYRISIAVPNQAAPKTGYPIIYLLDGHITFPIAKNIASLLIEQKAIKPIIIVGIDYAKQEQWITLRAQDYTPPHNSIATDNVFLQGEKDGGGAENFLKFINSELKPLIEQKYNIDLKQQALFGHSYGGLFTLFASFTQPENFRYYYAASPSIWWDNKTINQQETQLINNLNVDVPLPYLIISVGGLEQTAPIESTKERKQKLINRSQVTNAKTLADHLNQVANDKLKTQFFIFPEQNHAGVIPLAITQALTHFFKRS